MIGRTADSWHAIRGGSAHVGTGGRPVSPSSSFQPPDNGSSCSFMSLRVLRGDDGRSWR